MPVRITEDETPITEEEVRELFTVKNPISASFILTAETRDVEVDGKSVPQSKTAVLHPGDRAVKVGDRTFNVKCTFML